MLLGDDRFLIVYKKNATLFVPTNENATRFELSDESYEKIATFLEQNPLNEADKQNTIFPPNESQHQVHLPFMFGDSRSKIRVTVPPLVQASQHFASVRQSLPIYEYRDEILAAINQHQVIVVSGETGKYRSGLRHFHSFFFFFGKFISFYVFIKLKLLEYRVSMTHKNSYEIIACVAYFIQQHQNILAITM